jgi:hypothetical protein
LAQDFYFIGRYFIWWSYFSVVADNTVDAAGANFYSVYQYIAIKVDNVDLALVNLTLADIDQQKIAVSEGSVALPVLWLE